ncbi:hypothetical protein [Niveispirillum fermenti]|uniref:hypothetical protein n=1 Tax=Niveispirillum fermenti TaxID=1233113 RepID=UPI003A8C40B7
MQGVSDTLNDAADRASENATQRLTRLMEARAAIIDKMDERGRVWPEFSDLWVFLERGDRTTDIKWLDAEIKRLSELAGQEYLITKERRAQDELRAKEARDNAPKTPEQQKLEALQAQYDALRNSGVDAYDAIVFAQKMAEGGAVAAQAQIDKLRKELQDAAREGDAASKAFVDMMDDAARMLDDQAAGASAAEKAYRPFEEMIGRITKALDAKGLSEERQVELAERLRQVELAGALVRDAAAEQAERERTARLGGLRLEVEQAEERNQILRLEQAGTREARRQIIDLGVARSLVQNELERQAAVAAAIRRGEIEDLATLNTLYARKADAIRDGAGLQAGDPFRDEARQFSSLAQQAIVDGGLDAAAILRSAIGAGMGKALEDFYADFRAEMEGLAPGLADALGGALASFGIAQGIGGMLGLGKDRSRNAGIGAAAGYMVAGPWGALAGGLGGALFGGNSAEDLRQQRLAQERDALAKAVEQFLQAGTEMSATAKRVSDLQAQFGSLRAEAERLGRPLDEITRSYERQMRAIARDLEATFRDVWDRAEGREALADFRAMQKEQEQRIQDALIAEVELSQVRRANAAELRSFFKGLAADQVALFEGVARQVDLVSAKVSSLSSGIASQLDESVTLYRELASQVRAEATTLRGLVRQLRETIQGWDIGPDSVLGLDEQLSIAASRFAEQVALAQSGDKDAISGLSDLAGTYRDLARQFYGSSEQFFAVEDMIRGALAQVAMVTDARATGLEQLASLSLVQVELLGDLKDLLAANLGQGTADAIAAALSDGVLTIGEAASITSALDVLGGRLEGVTGPAAQAARLAVDTLKEAVTSGNIAAIAPALTGMEDALEAFRAGQIDEYVQALGATAAVMTAVENWVLDPHGAIPAAVAAAFAGGWFDQTLHTRIENSFREAVGVTPLPLPLTGTITDLMGRAIGTVDLPDPLTGQVRLILDSAVGQAVLPRALTAQVGDVLSAAIGDGRTGPSATAQMEALIAAAISAPGGGWSPAQTLARQIQGQFGQALSVWGDRPLTQRINEAFALALGADGGGDWRGTLRSVLDAGSPLLGALGTLRTALDELRAALTVQREQDGKQQVYDQALQAFLSPINSAAGQAWSLLAGAQDVEAGKAMRSTWYSVDASTGAILGQGGKDSDSTSASRANALASGLSGLAQVIERLTGGDIGSFGVNAGNKYGSGYNFLDFGISKEQSFGINDFEGIARSFVLDALSVLQGGDQRIVDILRNADLSNLQAGLSRAAQEIFALLNPPGFADGGLFGGGLRLVGERGPELEVTGPARYFSAPQTTALLRAAAGGGDAGTLDQLRQVNANLVRSQRIQAIGLEQLSGDVRRLEGVTARLAARIDPDMRVA